VISLGIGIASHWVHGSSLLAAGPALGGSATAGELTMDADDVPRVDAQAAAAVSVINETTRRAKRTIWLLLVIDDVLDP